MPKALVILLRWHEAKHSEAAHDVLLGPLAGQIDFDTVGVEWGRRPPPEVVDAANGPLVFFQTPPPAGLVERLPQPVTWIPMWDSVAFRPQRWWNALPRRLRVIAFSRAVAERARRAGLAVFPIQYAVDPARLTPAEWNHGRVALYWNRAGAVSRKFLDRFCATMQVDRLLVKDSPDPGYSRRMKLRLPSRIGRTVVEDIPPTPVRADYFSLTLDANMMIAPRMTEGVGLTYLEAMARGCVVFAADRPTMNETIVHGQSGVLLDIETLPAWQLWLRRRWNRALSLAGPYSGVVERYCDDQPWESLAEIDLTAVAAQARQGQFERLAQWNGCLSAYGRFLLGEDRADPSEMRTDPGNSA